MIDGTARLWLRDRQIDVATGEPAEFATMTPHRITALGEPAEVVITSDRDGQRAHVHH